MQIEILWRINHSIPWFLCLPLKMWRSERIYKTQSLPVVLRKYWEQNTCNPEPILAVALSKCFLCIVEEGILYTINYDANSGFFMDNFYGDEEVTFTSKFAENFFIMNGWQIFSNAFCSSIDETMWFFLFSLLML